MTAVGVVCAGWVHNREVSVIGGLIEMLDGINVIKELKMKDTSC